MMKTKEELKNFIDALNKKPGEYTQEELYQIGLEHKSLPQNQKSWKDLTQYVGYKGDYRQFIISEQRKNGLLSVKTPENLGTEDYEDTYKERVRIREILNEYNGHLRKEAKLESFLDALKEKIHPFAKSPTPKSPAKSVSASSFAEAVLPFADLHLGNDTNNYRNKFDITVAKKRAQKIVEDTIEFCKINKVDTLHFLNLGDLISGFIHETLRYSQKLNIAEQLMSAVTIVAEMLYQLNSKIKTVTYRSVTDNHSRMNANLSQNIDSENLNLILTEMLKLKLQNTDIIFLENNIDASIGKFYLKNGKCVVFAHGDKEKKASVVQDTMGLLREFPDYIFLAHYHNAAEHTFQGAKVFITGPVCGTDNYAFSHRLFGDAEQKLIIFKDDNILNISIMLQ